MLNILSEDASELAGGNIFRDPFQGRPAGLCKFTDVYCVFETVDVGFVRTRIIEQCRYGSLIISLYSTKIIINIYDVFDVMQKSAFFVIIITKLKQFMFYL